MKLLFGIVRLRNCNWVQTLFLSDGSRFECVSAPPAFKVVLILDAESQFPDQLDADGLTVFLPAVYGERQAGDVSHENLHHQSVTAAGEDVTGLQMPFPPGEEGLDAQGCFARPCHSRERGLNENTNGLIRQYLPKSSDFQTLTLEQVRNLMDKLNNRPPKCLGFKTPNQMFSIIKPPVALTS
jgi:hypothetical protein